MDEAQRIDAFWQWWGRHSAALGSLLDTGAEEAAVRTYGPLLAEQLDAVDSRLGYRIDDNAGRSRRTLTISAHGQPWLMALARRVRDGAPAPDRHWSYSNFIKRSPEPMAVTFDIDGIALELADTQITYRDMARRVDVGVWHPLFEPFTAEQQASLAAAMVDVALGEEHVQCWVGGLEALDSPPEDPVDLVALRRFVDDVRTRFVELPDASPWTTVQGTRYDGKELHARIRVPLCVAREPLLEKVVTIRLRLEDLRGPAADEVEEMINESIGADGELVAVETLNNLRTWYSYVRPDTEATQRLLDLATALALPVEAANDPTWEVVSHLS
ncbi:hypothetical protein [Tessaracoccus sp. MC1756]|uniref:hypothetical protein n=1 Tax=Tessaracoccus sp. MC1756 TaxID=2760311 RepID=UPI0015FF5567|nr:hypothetical protein [Tessaracoccus sp. MC1756]MBB1509959.1 hypothetical protein [Tessaracoccus sp. MC1756]